MSAMFVTKSIPYDRIRISDEIKLGALATTRPTKKTSWQDGCEVLSNQRAQVKIFGELELLEWKSLLMA